MIAAEKLLPRLEGVKEFGVDKWLACCPAHDDRHPSLSIRQAEDRVLLRCWAGCAAGDVVASVGLSLSDLFDHAEKRAHVHHGRRKPPLPTVREFLTLIEHCLAVVECAYADILSGVTLNEDDRGTATEALLGLRQILAACRES